MKKVVGFLAGLMIVPPVGGLCAPPEARTLVVFPFENQSGRPDLNWISESFSAILSSELAALGNYVVGRDERNSAYAQLEIPPDTPLTLASEYKVAEDLGVDWAIVGTFNVGGQRLSARAQLLDMRRLSLAPALEATGDLNELVDVQTQLVWRLLATDDPTFTVGKEEDFRRRFPEVRLDAFENYIRGILATDDESRIRFLREADRLNPADYRAAFELGRFYFEQKDYAESEKWLRKLEPRDANYLGGLFCLAVDEYFLGRMVAAEEGFKTLANQTPLSEVWNNLGVIKFRRGRFADALEDFERAYKGDSTDPDFCFNLGACLWSLKRYGEAARVLEQGLRASEEEDPEAHSLLAAVLGKLGDSAGQKRELGWLAEHEEAQTQTADLAQDFSSTARLKKNYDGRAFRWLSLTISNALEASLAKEPPARHSAVHLARGKAFIAEGRWDEAEREIAEAVSLLPEDGATHLSLAQVYEAKGRHQDAAKELETSLRLKNTVTAHLLLARVYIALDRPEAARAQGQAALALDPNNRDAGELIERIGHRASSAGKTP